MLDKFFNYFSYYQWWKNLDKFILSLIITLFLIGLFFSLVSTSLIASDKLNTNSYFFFFKHLVFVIIGIIRQWPILGKTYMEFIEGKGYLSLMLGLIMIVLGFSAPLFLGNGEDS